MSGIGTSFKSYASPVQTLITEQTKESVSEPVIMMDSVSMQQAQVLAAIGIKAAEMAIDGSGMAEKEPEPVSVYGHLADAGATIKGVLSDAAVNQSFTVYDGVYEITPKTHEQSLDTANKILVDDVLVHKVPYYETSNSAGGLTVYIANEI